MKIRILLFAALLFTNSSACAETNTAPSSNKPNILFIFADDMCYDTINALGNSEIRTPNIDRLARTGTTFTNTYNMGGWNGAICIASRTMLNTGKFIWRAKATKFNSFVEEEKTWSQLLSKAGYETYMTGKWHVGGLKTKKIFDHVIHERPGMPNQTPEGYFRPVKGEPDKWSPYDPKFEGFWKGGKHWSEVLADDATNFLANAAKSDDPFFMYLAFNAPHDPRQAPKKFVDMYPTDNISMPKNFLPSYPFKEEIGCYRFPKKNSTTEFNYQRDERLAPWPRTEYAVKVNLQEYYAIITHMDEQIGRILKALEETGKADNTYIFFTADHGLACGQHGLLGKQNMYEHSMRPPMILVGDKIPQNETRNAQVYFQDLMPTTLEIAGVEKPEHVDFNSLIPYINDAKTKSVYQEIYGCYEKSLQRMIRVDDWKLIVYPKAKVVRLFDLASDPHEMNDLASAPEQRSRVKEMFQRLVALAKDMDDALDLAPVFPDLASEIGAVDHN